MSNCSDSFFFHVMEGAGKQSSSVGSIYPGMEEILINPDHNKKTVHARRDQPGLSYCWRRARVRHLGRLAACGKALHATLRARFHLSLFTSALEIHTYFSNTLDMSSALVIAPNNSRFDSSSPHNSFHDFTCFLLASPYTFVN